MKIGVEEVKRPRVAYFCMEFGLHEDFKIYSGGLGILAGDILKAARDGNYPLVGVGILWRQGYTRQLIDRHGLVYDCYHEYQYDFLEDTGVTVQVRIRGRQVRCKIWKCTAFQNAPLYLLDANLPENEDRLITGQLYGWFSEERIAQEMILGVGGIRALKKLGIKVDVYHFNDSHPLPAGIELLREKIEGQGMSFEEALAATREQIVFTTHTPVKEGNEVHEHELLRYMGAYNGLTYGEMLKLGGEPFNMTVASMRLAKKVNAVAQLHAATARKMWSGVTGTPEIIGITNGVHRGTWQDPEIVLAHQRGESLWAAHLAAKRKLLEEVYLRNGVRLKEEVLTIGFARRMAAYKRGDLIFRELEVIDPLLQAGQLQLIFSGKAHPNDLEGKKIVARIYKVASRYPESVVFLQDYDMKIGRLMTRGCDLWLNNPRRPMEASGTSGMKAAMNGVLNFSVLDGWWPEGYQPGETGWQIGDGYEGPGQDRVDLESLYHTLLQDIIPTYYERRDQWERMMRASIEQTQWQFSAQRMVEEYYERLY